MQGMGEASGVRRQKAEPRRTPRLELVWDFLQERQGGQAEEFKIG